MATRKPKKHEWLLERNMEMPSVVLRIDDYSMIPLTRGQFVPTFRPDDRMKAIWPTVEQAMNAARWAAQKFGHTYAVFTMGAIIEVQEPPVTVTPV